MLYPIFVLPYFTYLLLRFIAFLLLPYFAYLLLRHILYLLFRYMSYLLLQYMSYLLLRYNVYLLLFQTSSVNKNDRLSYSICFCCVSVLCRFGFSRFKPVTCLCCELTLLHGVCHCSGKDEPPKLSLPKGLSENVDHSALPDLGSSVSERVNRFDSKRGGEGGGSSLGISKLQETRRIFEQRTLQVSSSSPVWRCGFSGLRRLPLWFSGEASCHQPHPAEEGARLRLPGQPSGRGGPFQRLHRSSGPVRGSSHFCGGVRPLCGGSGGQAWRRRQPHCEPAECRV